MVAPPGNSARLERGVVQPLSANGHDRPAALARPT